ncbi:hypothetical protein QYE76_064201 [Lolium multiflorum]|uniref:Peptidase A1 domain-containing protein n=1 Tax=Lolium multiflorum TaxID=4521 RepID=A0AAD8W7E4_LOLMU|nr:hypothetical protein QYE76_064201 [Lolium multiflorum]
MFCRIEVPTLEVQVSGHGQRRHHRRRRHQVHAALGPVYAAMRDAFRRRVRVPVSAPLGGFDTCYNVTVRVPSVALALSGGPAVTLPEENVMIHSSSGSVTCLAMAAGPLDGVNAGLNVLASMQQQNHRVLFDVANRRVGFSCEFCTT